MQLRVIQNIQKALFAMVFGSSTGLMLSSDPDSLPIEELDSALCLYYSGYFPTISRLD